VATTYTAKDITVLEGLEPVRKRPGMYIGGVGTSGLHHLVWEILDNAVDEAMNGFASNITVTLHADGSSITIADDGRGIPVDRHEATKKSALEVIFTVLHAGGKFEQGNYKTAGGLHGVGVCVPNALSTRLEVQVKREGALHRLVFGDNILIPRNRTPAPQVDHIAYTVANWDKEKDSVEAELKRRGLEFTGGAKTSFSLKDPDGYHVQFGGKRQ